MVMDLRHKPYDESSSAAYDGAVTSEMECPTLDSFEELCKALAERIDKSETRERGRTAEARQNTYERPSPCQPALEGHPDT